MTHDPAERMILIFKDHEKSDEFFHKLFIAIVTFLAFEMAFGVYYIVQQQNDARRNQELINRQQNLIMKQLNEAQKVSNDDLHLKTLLP
jgi:uncharacterized protein HemX